LKSEQNSVNLTPDTKKQSVSVHSLKNKNSTALLKKLTEGEKKEPKLNASLLNVPTTNKSALSESPREIGRYHVYNKFADGGTPNKDADNKDVLETINSFSVEEAKEAGLVGNAISKTNERKRSVHIKNEEEEFDPFYNLAKIMPEKVPTVQSTKWKLHINFDRWRTNFEKEIHEVLQLVSEEERRTEEMHKKEGIKRYFKIHNYADDNLSSQNQGLLDQEAENVQKQKEEEKLRQQNFKRIINSNKQETMAKGITTRKSVDALKQKQKIDQLAKLHKQELKGKMLYRKHPTYLSKEEADAAFRLAAALSNYDKDDIRTLRLLEVRVREINEKKTEKNFIDKNRHVISTIMASTSLAQSLSVPKLPNIHARQRSNTDLFKKH